MKILCTGGQGLLAFDLQLSAKEQGISLIALGRGVCDITSISSIESAVDAIEPTHIINAAAYTHVDLAETEIDQAFSVNAQGAKNLAAITAKKKIKLIQLSTDYVFDGASEKPYSEKDNTNPISVYGKSKRQGEIWAQEFDPNTTIVRLQSLYGQNGANFVSTMLRLANTHTTLQVVTDQIMSPSYSKDIAEAILALCQKQSTGIYHLHNAGHCSWFRFAQEIFSLAQIDITITPVTSAHFPRPAPRPQNSILAMDRYLELGLTPLRSWQSALESYMNKERGC